MSTQVSLVASLRMHETTLRMHLARHGEQGPAMEIGALEQLQTVVNIRESEAVSRAINFRHYPVLDKGQYLVACVNNWLETKVWGIYTAAQIEAMEAKRSSPAVNTIEWKMLDIPPSLEKMLRRGIFDVTPEPSRWWWCTLL